MTSIRFCPILPRGPRSKRICGCRGKSNLGLKRCSNCSELDPAKYVACEVRLTTKHDRRYSKRLCHLFPSVDEFKCKTERHVLRAHPTTGSSGPSSRWKYAQPLHFTCCRANFLDHNVLFSLTRGERAVQFDSEAIPDGVKKYDWTHVVCLLRCTMDNKEHSNNPRRLMSVSSGGLHATRVPNQMPNTGIGGLPCRCPRSRAFFG